MNPVPGERQTQRSIGRWDKNKKKRRAPSRPQQGRQTTVECVAVGGRLQDERHAGTRGEPCLVASDSVQRQTSRRWEWPVVVLLMQGAMRLDAVSSDSKQATGAADEC